MVCKFLRAKLFKVARNFQSFIEMMNPHDCSANSQNFYEMSKFNFFVESVLMDFLSLWFLG